MSNTVYPVIAVILLVAGLGLLYLTNSGLLPYHVLGFSLHEELGHLVDAGFTPYEAIEAGTWNAAEAWGRLDEFGIIAEGKRADVILVEENPLEDVANLGKRGGIMLRGHWLPEAQWQEMLDELANSYPPTFIERVWPIGLIAAAAFLILHHLWKPKGVHYHD